MKPIVRCSDIAQIDRRSQDEAHIDALILMESAGLQAWLMLRALIKGRDASLLFLVGAGNNGGDALVVSRYAYNEGYTNQTILLLEGTPSPSNQVQRAIIEAYGIATIEERELDGALAQAQWVIDGIAGTGLQGPLRSAAARIVELANASNAQIFSIDIPSGLADQNRFDAIAIEADYTVTMGALKSALVHPRSRARCGKWAVVNPSFPPAMLASLTPVAILVDEDATLAPLRRDAYKNTRGHVVIFGGSLAYSGALRLAGRGSFAARAGLVTLATDEELLPIAASEAPSMMVRPCLDVDPASYDVVLAGPGWGEGRESLLKRVLAAQVPIVIDADGITALAHLALAGEVPPTGAMIITPHLGELATLARALDIDDDHTPLGFFALIEALANTLDAVVVVKSSLVYVVAPGQTVLVFDGSNPSLGVAGSGDVLSGIIAGLWAGGINAFDAARIGVQIHQEAGRRAANTYGYYDSERLIDCVGLVVKEAES